MKSDHKAYYGKRHNNKQAMQAFHTDSRVAAENIQVYALISSLACVRANSILVYVSSKETVDVRVSGIR